jgi:outer membrane biosynthesis protein TonB
VPDRRSILRLLALAGFLLTVAVALWLAELRPLLVIVVMAIALLVASTVAWLSWRQDQLRWSGDGAEVEEERVPEPLPAADSAAASEHPVETVPSQPEPQAPAPLEPPAPAVPVETAAEAPAPAPPPDPEPVPEPPVPPPEPAADATPSAAPPTEAPAPAPGPPGSARPQPVLRPVPDPPPPAAPPAAQAGHPASAGSGVVDLRTRVTAQPRRWNLWDLERRARDEAQTDPLRYQQWSYLFVHLRQFAAPDGSLPVEFDGLVRESFGELLDHAGR